MCITLPLKRRKRESTVSATHDKIVCYHNDVDIGFKSALNIDNAIRLFAGRVHWPCFYTLHWAHKSSNPRQDPLLRRKEIKNYTKSSFAYS
jgi:hypothetical protein